MSYGAVTLDRDRLDYSAALASSWKQQTLLKTSATPDMVALAIDNHLGPTIPKDVVSCQVTVSLENVDGA